MISQTLPRFRVASRTPVNTYGDYAIVQGAYGHYSFDEASAPLVDLAGNCSNLVLNGSGANPLVSQAPVAKYGTAHHLNASGGKWYQGSGAEAFTVPFSICAWVQMDADFASAAGSHTAVETSYGGSFYAGITVLINVDGTITMRSGSNSNSGSIGRRDYITDNTVVSAGQKHFIVVIANAYNDYDCYIDGASTAVSYSSGTAGSIALNNGITFGRNTPSSTIRFAGKIDEVSFFNSAISEALINNLHSLGTTGSV